MLASLWLLALSVTAPVSEDTVAKQSKGKRPALELRVAPRFAFSPVTALFTAELKGGDDLEEYYCPEIEWEWGDGGKSVQEADCSPFEPGTVIERRFTAEHTYRRAANYRIKVTLKRTGRAFASQSLAFTVKPGISDASEIPD